jgi:hypothetical protein
MTLIARRSSAHKPKFENDISTLFCYEPIKSCKLELRSRLYNLSLVEL